MAEYDLGTAKGKIELDAQGVKRGVDEANRAIDGISSSTDRGKASLLGLSTAAAAAGAAVAAGFGVAINVAADFEAQLSGIKAVSGATEKEMDSLRKKALQLGADTAFSAGESAMAMEELVKAGLGVDDVLNGAADATVALAAAGGVALPEAATIASNAMNQFGLSAEEMPHVADLIAGAANASAIDVSEFGYSLSQAGAVANLVGLSFDDLSLAITAMGNAGIKGSDAGTSLKSFLTNLQPTTDKQKTLFYDLGLAIESNITPLNETGNAFFTAAGEIKSMSEIAGILGDSLEGMSEQQKIATLETIFGSDAIRAAGIIAGTGAEGFDSLAESISGITAADVAATRLDNFNGSVEQMKGSLETLMIQVGTPFLGVLRDIVDKITEGINALSGMDEVTRNLIVGVVGAVGALVGFLGAAGVVAHTMAPAIQGIQLLTAATSQNTLAMLASPWFWVVAAVIALAAGIYYAYTHFEGFREVVDKVIDRIVELAEVIWAYIKDVILPALKDFADFFVDEIVPAVVAFAKKVGKIIGDVVDFIVNDMVPPIKDALQATADLFVEIWGWVAENVIPTVEAIVELVVAVFDKLRVFTEGVLIPALVGAWNLIAPIISAAFDIIVSVIQFGVDTIGAIIGFFVDAVMLVWNLFGDNIVAAIKLAFDYIKLTVETVLGIVRGIVQMITGLISGDWDKFLEGLKTLFSTAWDAIKGAFGLALDAIKLAATTFIDTLKLAFGLFWDAVKLIFETAVDAIKLVLETAWTVITTAIQAVWDGIALIFSTVWNTIETTISTVVGTITSLLQGAWDTITGAVDTAWETVSTTVSDTIDDIIGWITDLPGDIAEFAGDMLSAGTDLASNLLQGIKDGIGDAVGFAGDVASALLNAVKSAWNKFANSINDLIPNSLGWGPASIDLPDDPIPTFAKGGIVSRATFAMIGEAGPEAIIPMTNPARALSLMAAAGLDRLLLSSHYGSLSTPSSQTTVVNSGATTNASTGVHVDTMIVNDSVDVESLFAQAEFAIQSTRF